MFEIDVLNDIAGQLHLIAGALWIMLGVLAASFVVAAGEYKRRNP